MNAFLLVAAGGAIGASLRHGATLGATRFVPAFESGGILFVNIVGSALMGILLGWFLQRNVPGESGLWLFLATGVLGGFTTFSAFSKDVVHMINTGEFTKAALYALVSVIASCGALFIALLLTRKLLA